MQAARRKVVAACDHSMPRRGHGHTGDSMYWWNDQLSVLRRKCLTEWRKFTRSNGDPLLREAWKKAKLALRQCIKETRLQCWKDLIEKVEKDPWNLAFKIVTKRLMNERNTPDLDNADSVKYIVRSLFSHVEPLQRQDRSSCVVRREELFTLEELKRAGGRLKANTAPGNNEVLNEILKEVIVTYPEILLEAFNSFLRERFFVDWKKQGLVLLRKGNKLLEDASSYRLICLLDTMGKLLVEMILQRLYGHMVGENGLTENQFGSWKGSSRVDAIQAVVDIATKARRGTDKRKGFCALISVDIRNTFNTARRNVCTEAMVWKKVPD